jgi:serine-type D-Ala-D-Ala carboxypeptidase (penicillin-binding protein 5/6)
MTRSHPVRPPRLLTVSSAAVAFAAATLASSAPSVAAPARSAAVVRAAAAGPGGVQARGADLVNAVTRRQLWSRALNTRRPMASITKVMTALVVIRAGGLNRTVRIPGNVVTYVKEHDASSAGLRPGDVLTVRQLLEGLLLPSGCDAALVLATVYGPGGWRAFVRKMNATADALGLRNTHFANFDGLGWPTEFSTYSTPKDLITLGLAAMRLPAFRAIVRQRSYYVAPTARHHAYRWQNTNQLLGSYPGAFGIKTGHTPGAGYCLLFEAQRGGRTLIGVVLNSSETNPIAAFTAAARILNWAFGIRAAWLAAL